MVHKNYKRFITSKWSTWLWLKGEDNESDCNKGFCHHLSSCVNNYQSSNSWPIVGLQTESTSVRVHCWWVWNSSFTHTRKSLFQKSFIKVLRNPKKQNIMSIIHFNTTIRIIISYISLYISYKCCLKKQCFTLISVTTLTKQKLPLLTSTIIIFLWKITTWAHVINFTTTLDVWKIQWC